ncbi:MAG TPA: four-carbon acid sugar kinase family protein, partial [Candidatus Limnocylindrales bacterium]|nr:four-carbon acid sugar kinase family protein [Candidatus Limnocylindrales bacterium]
MSHSLLITYYGDDFTGSTDTMEALTRGGVRTALFLAPPTPERMAQFEGVRAVGIAGTARTMSPAAMDVALPPIFEGMKNLGAPVMHYKMCSTGDSSPEIGSVGHAIDLAQEIIGSPFVPVLVATPLLNRFSAFGNLFARSGPESDVFRLDR